MKTLVLPRHSRAISTTIKPLILTLTLSFGILPQAGCETDEIPITPAPTKSEPSTTSPKESESFNGSKPSSKTPSAETGNPSAVTDTSQSRPNANAEPPNKIVNRDAELESIGQLLASGDVTSAEAKLKSLLVRDPTDAEVIFRLAMLVANRNDLAQAIELLDAIPSDHPDAGLPALGQSADWCFFLERYQEAEERYLKILEVAPLASQAHRNLAYLYNRQGRRHEAATHLYQLCRQGDVQQDELHALIQLSDAMYTPQGQAPGDPAERPYWPIGPAAEARRLFMEDKYQETVEVLRTAVTTGKQPPSVLALFGRAAAEAQDEPSIDWWLTHVDQQTQEHADYWAALGLVLLSENRLPEAGRALIEALVRDPTDFRSISRLRSILESLGQPEEAIRLEKRFQNLEAIARENNRIVDSATPNVEAMDNLAELLDSMDRQLESTVWRLVAGFHRKLSAEQLQPLYSKLTSAASNRDSLSHIRSRICQINREQFPLPNLASLIKSNTVTSTGLGPQNANHLPASFANRADEIGLQHAFQVASELQTNGFSVYQSVGGAVAVLDYDCDGQIDLYFSQGGGDPPTFQGDSSNQLYRGEGVKVRNITELAGAADYRYSLGVTAGDWNQDGFPDLVVANIGANTLLINNGDGTFRRQALDDLDDTTVMTTSLAMGDLTGDQLPDIFEVNYIHDSQISKRPRRNPQGQVIETLMPKEFQPGLDRLIIGNAQGDPTFLPMGKPETAARAGLGVVVGNFDHQPGNEVFVGNDVYANQLWQRDAKSGDWTDVAMLIGCAYGFNGAKTASMGIAAGDFDRNGWLDFHITNFQGESVSHYLNEQGMYQDRNIQFGFAVPSQSVLGFGTQALDYENDGDLDLVVANGHIEDSVNSGAPFAQPVQLFRNLGDRFELAEVTDDSGYWNRNHLGRGLARLDWNRDGLPDFVVTHLGESSALLVNQSPNSNHWVQLVLRGVESERDAVGARVELRAGNRKFTEWVTAGDGFFCRNEPMISFGLGEIETVEEMTIHWPSGKIQSIQDLQTNQRLLVIENQSAPFSLNEETDREPVDR
ncbi:MAG: FG-GAP-like repeat-containing protein [Rubripirellula sp.]